jgi:hypothetical protein
MGNIIGKTGQKFPASVNLPDQGGHRTYAEKKCHSHIHSTFHGTSPEVSLQCFPGEGVNAAVNLERKILTMPIVISLNACNRSRQTLKFHHCTSIEPCGHESIEPSVHWSLFHLCSDSEHLHISNQECNLLYRSRSKTIHSSKPQLNFLEYLW